MDNFDRFMVIIVSLVCSLLGSFVTCVFVMDQVSKLDTNYSSALIVKKQVISQESKWASDTVFYIRGSGVRDTVITVRQVRN